MSTIEQLVSLWQSLSNDDKTQAVDHLLALNESRCMENEITVSSKSVEKFYNNLPDNIDCINSFHSVICGDIRSTETQIKAVECLIEHKSKLNLIFTSPPYNANIKYDNCNDNLLLDDYLDILKAVVIQCDQIIEPGSRFVINIRDITIGTGKRYPIIVGLHNIFTNMNYDYRGVHIWYKGREESSTAWGSFKSSQNPAIIDLFEYVYVFQKPGVHSKTIDNMAKSEFIENVLGIWKIRPVKKIVGKHKENTHKHPCPFPIELAKRVIKLYSSVGDTVLDPFSGVCSSAVAALQSGRNSISVDISKTYCSEGIRRLQEYVDIGNQDRLKIKLYD